MDHQTPHSIDVTYSPERRTFTLAPRHVVHDGVTACYDPIDDTMYSQFTADHDRHGCPAVRTLTEAQAHELPYHAMVAAADAAYRTWEAEA